MKNIAVFGTNGGIGRALCEYYLSRDEVRNLYSFSRHSLELHDERFHHIILDATDEEALRKAAEDIQMTFDIIIVATGLLHGNGIKPEKTIRDLSYAQMQSVFQINTFLPSIILKDFSGLLTRDQPSVFACLSARIGSISDNRLGGWHSYRASKAALNMMIKTASIEIGRRWPKAAIIGLHPGTVDTNLSKPFQSNVPDDQLFTSQQSAKYLADVISKVDFNDTGYIFAWDGTRIEP